ncbi:MAG: acyl--CoA ligase [Acidimicrobiia bacterium]|nr:acyl--CoA ligase [Acidimicrobiia bacterium]
MTARMSDGPPADYFASRLRRATLGDVLERRALRDRDTPAVVVHTGDQRRLNLTYGQLDVLANRMGRALRRQGIGTRDVVAMMAGNGLDHIVTYYAALKIGAVFTTLNPNLTEFETARQLESARPRLIVAENRLMQMVARSVESVIATRTASDSMTPGSELAAMLEEEDPLADDWRVSEHDLAMIIYTSGTETEPKGVRIPHRNFLIATSPAWTGERYVEPDDRFLLLAPMHTMAGVGTVTNLISVGATIVLSASTQAAHCVELIGSERITNMSQTPTFYVRLTEYGDFDRADISSLRQAHTYGGVIPVRVTDAMSSRVPRLSWATYWGQTELSQLGAIGYYRSQTEIPGRDPRWIGRAVPQVEVRVVDEADQPTEVGELICRSPAVMEGYHRRPDLTAEVTRGGWLRTGDIVRIDQDMNLFFYDRKKDVIKSGGLNVSSLEVEGVLSRFPGVREVAVVGTSDPVWSEAVTAFIVREDGKPTDGAELMAAARRELAAFKVPKRIHYLRALPRDSQGKVLKRQLRELAVD